MLIILDKITEDTKKTGYISVYKPIAGWKAIQYWWNNKDVPGDGFWEPWQTGCIGWTTKEEATLDAKMWAEAEEIPFFIEKEQIMAHLQVRVVVSRIRDTGVPTDIVEHTENFAPNFSTWTFLMMLVGFLSSVKRETKDVTS